MLGSTIAQAFGFTTLYLLCAALATAPGLCFLALRRSSANVTRQVAPQ
jgi:hypothetical protein